MRRQRPDRRSSGGWLARGLWVSIAAAFVVGALPAVAGAADYCVAPNTSCGGTNVASLQGALDQAANTAEPDRVFLGATIYPAPDPGGYSYHQASSPVEIVGQGAGQTILTSPAGGGDAVVSLAGGAGSSIHDLTIRLPFQSVNGLYGLITSNTARRIEVIEHQTQSNARIGVGLQHGGTLEDSSVTLNSEQTTTAVQFGTGGGAVRRSALSAWTGVRSNYGGAVEGSRVTVSSAGVAAHRGVTTVRSSAIRLTEPVSVGVYGSPSPGDDVTVNADGVMIIGPGLPNTSGVEVFTNFAPTQAVDLSLTNSIIRGVSTALLAIKAGTGPATIAASYSDYDASGNSRSGGATIGETSVSNVGDAGFVDAAGGDYHLRPGSPLVDMGDPATAQGLDLDGNPLVADGNGDGSVRRDIGAFELQPAPAGSGGQPPAGAGQPGGAVLPDTQAPLVSGFRAAPSVFVLARTGTPLAGRVGRGTRFRYTLSEPAQVRVLIQRALVGRRWGGKCARPSPQLRRAQRCTRYRTAGTLKRSGTTGPNRIRFSGRIGKRGLRIGNYRAVITATDAAGNRSTPRHTRFRVTAN